MTSSAARLRVRRIATLLAVLALPALAHAVCAPTARGIFPASGDVGTVVDAVVEGESLDGATVTVFGDPGLDAVVQSASDLAVNVHLTIDAIAAPEIRNMVLNLHANAAHHGINLFGFDDPLILAPHPVIRFLGRPHAKSISTTLAKIDLGLEPDQRLRFRGGEHQRLAKEIQSTRIEWCGDMKGR